MLLDWEQIYYTSTNIRKCHEFNFDLTLRQIKHKIKKLNLTISQLQDEFNDHYADYRTVPLIELDDQDKDIVNIRLIFSVLNWYLCPFCVESGIGIWCFIGSMKIHKICAKQNKIKHTTAGYKCERCANECGC